jgi:hypothetical protein
MTKAHQELIERFYTAFQKRDAEEMAKCYHDEVVFSDPVFTHLVGEDARNMWRMLCERGEDLRIRFDGVEVAGQDGQARWEAWYTFSQTKRKVHNVIGATFEFKDGLIVRHKDDFNLYRWTRQALGAPGLLLGWTPFLRNKLRGTAAKGLKIYSERRA